MGRAAASLRSTRYIAAGRRTDFWGSELHKVLLQPIFNKGHKVFGPGFFEDVFAVRFHRAHAYLQLLTNLFAGVFVEDEPEDFGFAGGKIWHGTLSFGVTMAKLPGGDAGRIRSVGYFGGDGIGLSSTPLGPGLDYARSQF